MRPAVGVDVSGALNLVGRMVKYFSLAFLFPIAVGLGYGDPVWPFVAAGAITALFGWGLERCTTGGESIGAREGFLVVSLTWALSALAISVSYMFGEAQLRNPIDAYFESMSGMTTTGATVLTDIPALNHTMNLWRCFSQWLGGMGIVVLSLAILPRLRVGGGRALVESEMPGPEYEPLAIVNPHDSATPLAPLRRADRGDDPDPVDLRLGRDRLADDAVPGCGARIHDAPDGWILAAGSLRGAVRGREPVGHGVFMVLAGANFALHFRVLDKRFNPMRDEEFRAYIVIILVAIADPLPRAAEGGHLLRRRDRRPPVGLPGRLDDDDDGLRSANFVNWTLLTSLTLVAVMLIGGCAGSTGGAIKVVRHLLIAKILRRELDQTVHREAVLPIRLNGRVVDERTLRAILAFGVIYVGLFLAGTLILTVESARAGVDVTALDAMGASATTLGNVGPGFGFAGPFGTFDPFSPFAKLVMILLMWAGRLEIIPIAVLLTRRYWRA